MNEKIEKAIKFISQHLGNEKDLGKPVLLHSLRVGFNLLDNGYGGDIIIAGFLHDIIEDSDIGESTIENEFGKNVLDIILANSKNYSLPEEARDIDLFNRCADFGKDAMIVKGYDILDNYNYFSKTSEQKKINRIKYLLSLYIEKLGPNSNEIIFHKLKELNKQQTVSSTKEIYKQTPAYKHLTQMPSCCGPTCIQMVLFRNGIWVEQEQLAYDLGLVIEENNKPYYTLPFKVVPKGDPTHGLKFYHFEEDQIIGVLKGLGFKPNVIYYSKIENFEKLVIENITKNNDIVLNFKWEGISQNNYKGGHLALLSSYDSDSKIVTICDPTKRMPNYWEVDINELKEAMSDKWNGRERGVVIIEKIIEAT